MKHKLEISALEQLFINARTFNRFTDRPVSEDTLRELYELLKWGPTAVNSQPARYVFIQSQEGKKKLMPALIAGNVEKTRLAPVTVILAMDRRFFDKLPDQFLAFNAKPIYETSSDLAQETGLRNGSMQGAYLMLAARALGLDCGPMSGFDRSVVDAAFFPDGKWASNFLVNLGYGDEAHNYPRGPRLPYEEVVRLA